MFKLFVGASFLLSTIVPATARTLNYEYIGKPFTCGGDPFCIETGYGTFSALSGSLSIDEAELPEGTIANSSLTLEYTLEEKGEDGGPIGVTLAYALNYPDAKYFDSIEISGAGRRSEPFDFISFDGIIGMTLYNVTEISTSSYKLSFNQERRIISWAGDSGLTGGPGDFSTNPSGDSYAAGAESVGPGEWVRVDPIPLPFTAPLLLTGLGGLMLPRLRRHTALRLGD